MVHPRILRLDVNTSIKKIGTKSMNGININLSVDLIPSRARMLSNLKSHWMEQREAKSERRLY